MLFFLVCLEWDDGITKEEAAFTKMLSGWLRTYFTVTVPFIMCYNVLQKNCSQMDDVLIMRCNIQGEATLKNEN